MSITLIRIFFFSLIPIGIIVLIKGIKLIRRSFYGPVYLEITYLQGSGEFMVNEPGSFSIWHKAPLLKRIPLDKYRPHITDLSTQQEIPLAYSYSGMQTGDFSDGRKEIFTFDLPVGRYKLGVRAGNSLPGFQRALAGLYPDYGPADLSRHSLQVRRTQPQMLTFLAIPVIIAGGGGIIGGFVLGLLADQVFK